jgi:cullin 1
MCTQRTPFNWSELLYTRHGDATVEYLTKEVVPPLKAAMDGTALLNELRKRWNNHKLMNEWMAKFFMYLDRYYVKHTSLPTLRESGLKHFKDLVYSDVKSRVTASMLDEINAEREGREIGQDLLRSCVQLFEAMGIGGLGAYTSDFEAPLLESTEAYYNKQATQWLETDSAPAYLEKAEAHLDAERKRVTDYLNAHTEAKLLKVCEIELLQVRVLVFGGLAQAQAAAPPPSPPALRPPRAAAAPLAAT